MNAHKAKLATVFIAVIYIIAGMVVFPRHAYGAYDNTDTNAAAPGECQRIKPGKGPQDVTADIWHRIQHHQTLKAVALTDDTGHIALPHAFPTNTGPDKTVYHRGHVNEWYLNQDDSIKQGFTLFTAADGSETVPGSASLSLRYSKELTAHIDEERQNVTFHLKENDPPAYKYTSLKAWDAQGHTVPAHIRHAENKAHRLQIVLRTEGAVYPITIDSLLTPSSLFANAPYAIALVYKYKSVNSGATFVGAKKLLGFIVVESTGGKFGDSAMITFFPEYKNYILTIPSGYTFYLNSPYMGVTYQNSPATYHISMVGHTKSMTFKGVNQGEKFQKTVQGANSFKGAYVVHAGSGIGYGKAMLTLYKSKMKHCYNEGDVRLNDVVAHLERILQNKLGYTRLNDQ